MREDEHHIVAPRDLSAVLKMYLSTGLIEWIQRHSNMWEQDEIFDNVHDPRMVLEGADFGLAGAVSKLWTECLDDVVQLLIWHNAEVRRRKVDVVGKIFDLGTSWIFSVAASKSRLRG
jgi:hypothetical protein